MTQSSIANGVIFSLLLFSAPICANETASKDKHVESKKNQKTTSQKQDEKPTDIEKVVKQWEDATTKFTKQLNSATGKMNGAIKQAKDSEGYTIQVGDVSITVDKGNPYYLKMFMLTVLLKEILKQYDENPTVATKKMIEHGKKSFTLFAQTVGFMKKPVPVVKPWWRF